jgi:CheY-like chemotaxis protein
METILVVDDDPIQRMAATLTLRKAGYEVLEAASGEEALESARTHWPDLIVSDVVMPGMNGLQLLAALRQEPRGAAIPVILLTSLAERAQVRLGMTSGAEDYLTKPFQAEELYEAVTSLLAKRDAQRRQVIDTIKPYWTAAMDEQKNTLATQYETRLLRELDARWNPEDGTAPEVRYPLAAVLLADLFGNGLAQCEPTEALTDGVRRAYQAARDAVYLFGARHLVPHGGRLLAVYPAGAENDAMNPPAQRAARAALALVRSVGAALARPDLPPARVALHCGPVTLLSMHDPLHGDPQATLAAGPTLRELELLLDTAASEGWRVAASAAALAESGAMLKSGNRARAGGTLDALELVGVNPTS